MSYVFESHVGIEEEQVGEVVVDASRVVGARLMCQKDDDDEERKVAGALAQQLAHSHRLDALVALLFERDRIDGRELAELGAARLEYLAHVLLAHGAERRVRVQILLVVADDGVVERIAAVDEVVAAARLLVGLAQHARDYGRDDQHLDRIDDEHRLEDGEEEGGQPRVRSVAAPLHRVQDDEECRHEYANNNNYTHTCTHKYIGKSELCKIVFS